MREREIHQKSIENEVKIRPKIDAKSIQISYSEKWCKKHRKSSTIELKRGAETVQKSIKNVVRKSMQKKEMKGGDRVDLPVHPGFYGSAPGYHRGTTGVFGRVQLLRLGGVGEGYW